MSALESIVEGNEVIEAPESFTQLETAERNVKRRSMLCTMLNERHNGVGKKIIKGMFMRPKRRAGRPATGKGEWRSLPHKGKTQKTQPAPSAKKEQRR